MVAGDQVPLIEAKSLCKPDLPTLAPVEVLKTQISPVIKTYHSLEFEPSSLFVGKAISVDCGSSNLPALFTTTAAAQNLPVEAVSKPVSDTNNSSPGTCVSTCSVPSATSLLSPLAQPFLLIGAPYLYPAGKDKLGRDVITSEDSLMHLDYFETTSDPADVVLPATPDIKDVRGLRPFLVKLPDGQDFTDRILPPVTTDVTRNEQFSSDYFLDLHNRVRLGGTYNFAGSRVQLAHSKIRVDTFRSLLKSYDDIGILQLLEFGFPLGIAQDFELKSSTQNHSSSYEFFSYLDEFFKKEVSLSGVTGPFANPPFLATMVSPLMTATKKPNSRRPVFDASYGDFSINNNTPEKEYMGDTYSFTFPTVLDLAALVIQLGPGCLLWKRDLSRWFLQLPVDPCDYDKLGVIWRGAWFLFVSYVWGCRHAGYNAQRVSSAILHILKDFGLDKHESAYNAMVYIDDFAGAEQGEKAWDAFNDLGTLLEDLGVSESKKKALSPSTQMVFLGVEFDTVLMCMRVGEEKRAEVKSTINKWYRRTVATKQELQSLQGQLMWISKVVRFSRCFVTRIIAEQKSLKSQKQKKTLSDDIKKDLLWWKRFLDVFNGVELLVPQTVFCNVLGDATLAGAGAWNEELGQFWSRKFPLQMQSPDVPIHLKEFFTVIIAVKIWGSSWAGKRVALHCDNSSVVETINHQKPKDAQMQQCLREFLFQVTTLKFEPVMVRIPTSDNFLADFISRNHNTEDIKKEFLKCGVEKMDDVVVTDEMFFFTADW